MGISSGLSAVPGAAPAHSEYEQGRSVSRQVQVLTTRDCLSALGDRLDDLHRAAGCPVTARRPWLQVWLDCYPDYHPLVVTVGSDGRLDAVAPLAYRRRMFGYTVVPIGAGRSDQVRLPARDERAAQELAVAVREALAGLRRPWRLVLRDLSAADPTVAALIDALPLCAQAPGDGSPGLSLGDERSVQSHVSRKHRQLVRWLHNRLRRAGLEPEFRTLVDVDGVTAVLPEVEQLCRDRDYSVRGNSQLDDPSAGPFFTGIVKTLAARGEVELTTLRLASELAAFVLCFVDGDARRVWSCRISPKWAAYSPGHLAIDAALQTALADPACRLFDWMRGEESYKRATSNHVDYAVDLFASSNAAAWAIRESARRGRLRLRDVKNRHARLDGLWKRGKRYLASAGLAR